MNRLLLLAGALVAATALALPAGAAPTIAPQWSSGSGTTPGTAVDTAQTTVLSTAVNPINGFWNQGWWATNETNSNDNTNYIAGHSDTFTADWRDYFTFDITSLQARKFCRPQSATLTVERGTGSGAGLLIYSLYGVDTDPVTLSQKVNNPDAAIFNDLGSGPVYGTYLLPTTAGPAFSLPLNTTALNAIAAAKANGDQFFSLGGSLVPQPVSGERWILGFTGASPVTLTVNWPILCRIRPPA